MPDLDKRRLLFRERIRNTFSIRYMCYLMATLLTSFFGILTRHEISKNKATFFAAHQLNAQNAANAISEKINDSYRLLRLMTRHPKIMQLSRSKPHLDSVTHKTIQEIYNTLYTSLQISEIYFTDKDFDPERVDLRTHHPQTPLATFDQFIVGKSADSKVEKSEDHAEEDHADEVEDFEYAEMKKQIAFFKSNYPTIGDLGLNYPFLVSRSLVTCDNSYFSKKHPNDDDRSGLLLSVPIYNNAGQFSGMSSAVVLNRVLQNLIPNVNMVLRNSVDQRFYISTKGAPLESPETWFAMPQSRVFDVVVPIAIESLADSKWSLGAYSPDSEFWTSSVVKVVLLVSLLALSFLWFGTFALIRAQEAAQRRELQAKDQTSHLQEIVRQNVDEIDRQRASLFAAEKMAELGQMAGGIAHEINNPLAMIVGLTRRLYRRVEGQNNFDAEIKTIVEKIDRYVNRIAKIVTGLRTISRDGSQDPFVPSSIKQIIDDTLTLTLERFINNGLKLEVFIEDDVIAECRSVQISQVLINLINNSFDELKGKPSAWVRLESQVVNGLVELSVTDSGNGIPEHISKKIMQPFFTTKAIGHGTGLGLSISHGILKSHGGELFLDPQSPNTRFVLRFPIVQHQTKEAKAA